MVAPSLFVPVTKEDKTSMPFTGVEHGEPEETKREKLEREQLKRKQLVSQSAQTNTEDILRWLRQEMNRQEYSYAKLSALTGVSEPAIKSWYSKSPTSRRSPGLVEVMKCLQALNFILIPSDGVLYLDDTGDRSCNPIDWFRHHLANRELQDSATTRKTSVSEEHARSNENARRALKMKTHKPRSRIS